MNSARPSTLPISCGSQIAVVTPCRRTHRSNSSGVMSDDSTWQCVSMNPETTIFPRTSISRAPEYSPIVPTMRSQQIATSLRTSSPLTRSKTRPPLSTTSALASPWPCSIARERKAMASLIAGLLVGMDGKYGLLPPVDQTRRATRRRMTCLICPATSPSAADTREIGAAALQVSSQLREGEVLGSVVEKVVRIGGEDREQDAPVLSDCRLEAPLHWRKIGQTEAKNASKINRRFCAFLLKTD